MPEEAYPVLDEQEFRKLVGKEGSEYFIPFEVRNQDLLVLSGALSLGVVVFANDKAIMEFVQENKTEVTQSVATLGNLLGREAIAPIAAGAYFIGAVMKDDKLKRVGLFAVAGGIATQIVTEAFKKSFQRMRPNASEEPYDFFVDHNNSFFSGHTSGAFSLATVVAEVYKDKPLIPYLSYGLASLTAYARMHDKKHWGSDVLMGAIAGHLVTKILMRSFEASERSGGGFVIRPEYGIDEKGNSSGGVQVYWNPKKDSSLACSKYDLTGNNLVRACLEEVFSRSR